jgi:hypothetical protein
MNGLEFVHIDFNVASQPCIDLWTFVAVNDLKTLFNFYKCVDKKLFAYNDNNNNTLHITMYSYLRNITKCNEAVKTISNLSHLVVVCLVLFVVFCSNTEKRVLHKFGYPEQ